MCKQCTDGRGEEIPLEDAPKSTSVTLGLPSEAASKVNEALGKLEAIGLRASIETLQVTGTQKEEECCNPKSGKNKKLTQSASGKFGSGKLQAKLFPTGPGLNMPAKYFSLGFIDVKASFVAEGGIYLGFDGSIEGEVGRRVDACRNNEADAEGCYFAQLNTTISVGLSASFKIGGSLTFDCTLCDTRKLELTGGGSAGASIPVTVSGISYNVPNCDSGLQGGLVTVGDATFTVSTEYSASYESGDTSFDTSGSWDLLTCTVGVGHPFSCEIAF